MKNIVNLCLLALLFVNCNNKPAQETIIENNDTIITENLVEDEIKSVNNSNIILSTEDLSTSDLLTPEEIMRNAYLKECYDDGATSYIVLPSFGNKKIVIVLLYGGDYPMYYLCVINFGIINIKKSLDITPHWSEPGNDENNYCKKTFKIYEDYTIEIHTEEGKNGKVKKYTQQYRINDEGNFYGVENNE